MFRNPSRPLRASAIPAFLVAAMVATILALSTGTASAAPSQVLIMSQDGIDTATHYADHTLHGPTDLVRPVDYSSGRAFAKIDLIDKPSDLPVLVQICFWRDKWKYETCSAKTRATGPDTLWIDMGRLTDWWDKTGTFSWSQRGDVSRVMIKDAATQKLLKRERCGAACYPRSDLDKHVPIRFTAELIAVAPGANLNPIAGWQDCPSSWSPNCTGDPANAGFAVEAGHPITVAPNETIGLNGIVYDGPAKEVVWWKAEGPASVAWTDRFSQTPTVRFKQPGNYVLKFRAESPEGLRVVDELYVTVSDGATPPADGSGSEPPPAGETPDAGTSQPLAVDAGDAFTTAPFTKVDLNGIVTGGSGNHTAFWWKKSGSAMSWSSKSGTSPTVSFSTAGTYQLVFKATDGTAADQDILTVTVADGAPAQPAPEPAPEPEPTPPAEDPAPTGPLTVDAGRDFTVAPRTLVQLDGTVSSASNYATVWMKQQGGGMTWSSKSVEDPTVSFGAVGTYVLTFKANDGTTAARDDVTVTVVDGATPSEPAPSEPAPSEPTPSEPAPTEPTAGGPSLRIVRTSVTEGNGGMSTLVFKVVLSEAAAEDLTFTFFTEDGSAVAGEDYVPRNETITVEAGQRRVFVGVPVYGDRVREGDEQLSARIADPSIGTIDIARATGTILNDD